MKFAAVDVRQAASAADLVYEALRKAIIEGKIVEGDSLRQEEIAQMFNTSRIPVREALSRLEQHGLITTQRYKGAVVAGLSIEEIDEIFEFRALIEAEVMRLAVPNLDRATLDKARGYCDAFDRETDTRTAGARSTASSTQRSTRPPAAPIICRTYNPRSTASTAICAPN